MSSNPATSPVRRSVVLPTGTLTFLLTDVEGSTRLWQTHADAMEKAIARHDQLVAEAVEEGGGFLIRVRGEGDSWFSVFGTAANALVAALSLQHSLSNERWPEGITLRVRIALHSGEAELREGTYYGSAVNRCARLRAVAHGGQVVVTRATHELVKDRLPPGATLRDLGHHRLKDLTDLEQVFQLCHNDLPASFPPLASLDARPHNLPVQRTAFIGRESELLEVRRLLSSTSLLTLTGSGGAGKSRLALQVASEVLGDYVGGTWLVQLAPLSNPKLVPSSLATILGLPPPDPGHTLTDSLCDFLALKNTLLVLDNCEHLVLACAELADQLLSHAPGVKILATSREPLRVSGETTWRIPSLSLPDPVIAPTIETLRQCESARLFIDRATLSQPDFDIADPNAAALAKICRRLDGMPLAIELAAARVRALTVPQIAARLEDQFHLLTGGPRTALPRQQTIRATIDWSYALLSESERTLLRRLAVFAGGFTLEAAEGVGSANGIALHLTLDLLSQLVDKSLVTRDASHEPVRYGLLDTVRQYVAEKLTESGERARLQSRHRDWFLELARRGALGLRSGPERTWLERFEAEHDNFRTALEWCLATCENTKLLQLADALWIFWWERGHLNEGVVWLRRALERKGDAPPALRASAIFGAAFLCAHERSWEEARPLAEQGFALVRGSTDLARSWPAAVLLFFLGQDLSVVQGKPSAARALIAEGLSILGDLGEMAWAEMGLWNLAHIALAEGDAALARSIYQGAIEFDRQGGSEVGLLIHLHSLGELEEGQGDYARARSLYQESLDRRRETKAIRLGNPHGSLASILMDLARVSRLQGDIPAALVFANESLVAARDLGEQDAITASLATLKELKSPGQER